MMDAKIKYYARLTDTTGYNATLKYSIDAETGEYEPMKQLVGRDGYVSFNLIGRYKDGESSATPCMRFQGKNSINVTGLYDYFIDGKLSGIAFGSPYDRQTYSKEHKPNPFYRYRMDGFLFIFHFSDEALRMNPRTAEPNEIRPDYIEMLVLDGAVKFIAPLSQQLQKGGFDVELEDLRKRARPVISKGDFEKAMKSVG